MEAIENLVQESLKNLEDLRINTEDFEDINLKCVKCGITKIYHFDSRWPNQYKLLKKDHDDNNYNCVDCRKKHSDKKARFEYKNQFRISCRNALKKEKEISGIKKRFLNCSFENYNGKNYRKEIYDFSRLENILIYGSPGCGKSHLSCSYMSVLLWHGIKCLFITTAELLMEIKSTFKEFSNLSEDGLIKKYIDIDILFLDDIGVEKTTEWVLQTLYLIIDGRYSDQKQTVFTSNLSPKEISEKLGDRMASRICSGKIIKIESEDYRIKR